MAESNVLFYHSLQLTEIDVDDILRDLSHCDNTTGLILNNNRLRDAGVRRLVEGLLSYPNIIQLGLRNNGLTDASCSYLSELKHLKHLDLSLNAISDVGVTLL